MTGTDGAEPIPDFDDSAQLDDIDYDTMIDELLAQPPALLSSPRRARSLAAAQADKAHQQNQLRQRFFTWARWIVSGALAGNFGIFITYMVSQWNHIADKVMMAWISATVVEVLGLAYIIAKYLFGDPKTPPKKGKK
jgi:hypothetical protein